MKHWRDESNRDSARITTEIDYLLLAGESAA
jgi:hypothetical protein